LKLQGQRTSESILVLNSVGCFVDFKKGYDSLSDIVTMDLYFSCLNC